MDVLATVALGLACLLAAGGALFASPFLLMATDSAGEKADLKPLGWAYVVTWGGVALGVTGAALGVYRAARHSQTMWVWPALGIVVIGAAFGIGGLLAVRAGRKSA